MGVFDTYRVAGGEAGHAPLHGAVRPLPRLALDAPDRRARPFDDALVDLIAGQSDAQSGHIPIRELERIRDDNLVAIQQALQGGSDWGAGQLLAEYEQRLFDAGAAHPGARPLEADPPRRRAASRPTGPTTTAT